ncbi:11067_t:CDS:2 [Paraglomus occultum]|uniref:11067_t:CDS:1 n=1 Tax=Paraglomus occultum TaxID=144539 RepID=A0A9N9GCP9_9GLOM|nr:11067_t:CDS:2 [Paraglomus occultum]
MSSNDRRPTVAEEDDDFDDLLDEILDDFTQDLPAQSSGHASSSKDSTQKPPTEKDLEREVEELFNDKAFEDTFHALLQAFDDASIDDSAVTASNTNVASQGGETGGTRGSFQDHINQTMNQLRNSSDQLDLNNANFIIKTEMTDNEDLLSDFVRALDSIAESGDFTNLVENMMDKLTTRDLLYEPMKELGMKYPQWLKDNKEKVSREDYERYEKQYECVQKIVAHFESQDPGADDEEQKQIIVGLMEEMQKLGHPPDDILYEFAPDVTFDENGFPELPPDLVNQF